MAVKAETMSYLDEADAAALRRMADTVVLISAIHGAC